MPNSIASSFSSASSLHSHEDHFQSGGDSISLHSLHQHGSSSPPSRRSSVSSGTRVANSQLLSPSAVHSQPQSGGQNISTNATPLLNTLPPASGPTQKLKRFSTQPWLWEFVCWMLALVSLIGMIIILQLYNGKSLPQWPLGITINAAISILATVSQMAMVFPVTTCISQLKWLWFAGKKQPLSDFDIFDEASRGVLGSVRLLFRPRFFRNLVVLGAFIVTTGTIAYGPMTQQVVTYPLRMVPSVEVAAAPRVQNYTIITNPAITDPYRGNPDPTMKSAVYTGFLINENHTVASIAPTCPTGNCTWPIFNTLGVCADVVDLTDQLNSTCPQNTSPRRTCNYTLPNGVTLQSGSGSDDDNIIIAPRPFGTDSLVFPGDNSTVIDFFIINTSVNGTLGEGDGDSGFNWDYYTGANALECILRFCVLSVNTTSTSGNVSTEFTQVRTNASLKNPSMLSQLFWETWLEPEPDSMGDSNNTTTYIVGRGVREAINYWANDYFQGTGEGGSLSQLYFTSDTAATFTSSIQRRPRSQHQTGITKIMRNIASSMTNNIRTYGDGTPAIGVSLTPQVYAHVQWEWLTLPISLIALSLILLISTILQGRRRGLQTWKSSSLAALLGLNIDTRQTLPDLQDKDTLDRAAKGVSVLLAKTDRNGWSLVEA